MKEEAPASTATTNTQQISNVNYCFFFYFNEELFSLIDNGRNTTKYRCICSITS